MQHVPNATGAGVSRRHLFKLGKWPERLLGGCAPATVRQTFVGDMPAPVEGLRCLAGTSTNLSRTPWRQAAGRPTRHREVLQLDLPLAGAALVHQAQLGPRVIIRRHGGFLREDPQGADHQRQAVPPSMPARIKS